jgi:hypothetical protein
MGNSYSLKTISYFLEIVMYRYVPFEFLYLIQTRHKFTVQVFISNSACNASMTMCSVCIFCSYISPI